MSQSGTFALLDRRVQRWIRDQGWKELRPVQEVAGAAILQGDSDVLISAETAAGKTEAAFLPLLTKAMQREVEGRHQEGLAILYISPLKALINDQYRRLSGLCEAMDLPCVRWHGDAPQSAKDRLRRDPRGVVLITPESIEAMLLRRPRDAKRMFGSLDAILIDELHAFLSGARGLHLASLLRRIDAIANARARRVGLSATLGDLAQAARWLNPQDEGAVRIVAEEGSRPELRLQIRGYVEPPSDNRGDRLDDASPVDALSEISDHLFARIRGSNNLVFAGARRNVEALSWRLTRRAEEAGVPNEFFPHHGSLSKELREDLETRLKKDELPTTAVATTTLELGIDIGSVHSIAQLGPPRSLASLRQRLGRSGRREGSAAILRIYLRERHLVPDSGVLDRLRVGTAVACAAIDLLLEGFIEASAGNPALATVSIHQTLSAIVERGALRPTALHRLLFGDPPFEDMTPSIYADVLRAMASTDSELIEQAPDGTLMLGRMGEILTTAHDFYAVFETQEEWRLVHAGRALGTIPLSNAVGLGSILGFAGKRWRVTSVDDRSKVVEVAPHPSGMIPRFESLTSETLDDRLVAQVRQVLATEGPRTYLDGTAATLLREGQSTYDALDLKHRSFVAEGNDTLVLTWRGTALNDLFSAFFRAAGLECEAHDLGLTLADTTPEEAQAVVRGVSSLPPAADLCSFVGSLRQNRFDPFLDDNVLARLWVCRNERLTRAAEDLLSELQQSDPN